MHTYIHTYVYRQTDIHAYMHAYGQTGMKAYMRTHTDRKAYIHNTYMQTDLQSEGEARVRVRQESERCKSEGETRVRATQEARVRVRK